MKINAFQQFNTVGIQQEFKDRLSDLWVKVLEEFKKQPDICIDGGNDKEFFSFEFLNKKVFVAKNELNGLTVMLPNEY